MLDRRGIDGLLGRSFNGFRVTRFIARGGMGVVFEAVQESLARPVAIKFLYPHLSDDETFRERFEREARAVARLNHPNIVRVLDFGSEDPLHYIVMDLVEGESLRDRLARIHAEQSTLRTDTIISIIQQVGGALSYAHRFGYVHRDIKPGNILLAKDGRAFLTDFGVVKIIGDSPMTMAGAIVGTPEYMSPEQSSGDGPVSPQSDLYSLAVVTYELMVGRVPFQAPTPLAVMRMQMTEPPPAPSTWIPWFPPEIEAVLMRGLAKDPAGRYESVDAFVESLMSTRQGTIHPGSSRPAGITPPPTGSAEPTMVNADPGPVRTPTPPPPPPTSPPASTYPSSAGSTPAPGKSRRLAVIGGALAVVLVAAAVGGYAMFGRGGTTGSTAGASSAPSGSSGYGAPLAAGPNVADKILFTGHPGAVDCDATVPNSCQPVHDSQVYMMNPDGSDLRQLTITPGHSWAPRVSPDGTKVIYSSVVKVGNAGTHTVHQFEGATGGAVAGLGHHDIFLAEINGARIDSCNEEDCVKNVQTVTSDDQFKTAWNNGWSWSPDGQWITFMSVNLDANGTPTGPYQLYKVNPTTKQVVHLNPSGNNDGWPSWTPDGKHILFSSIASGQDSSDIYEMDPDGSNVRQVTHGVLDKFNFNQFPTVSPDGQQILFACGVRGGESQICLMGIDGSHPIQLTQSPTFKDVPYWSPDGTKIVYAEILDNEGNQNIYTMNKDGSNQQSVTHGVSEQTTPSWARISRTAQ